MRTAFGYAVISSDGTTATTADISSENPIVLLNGSGAPLTLQAMAGQVVRLCGQLEAAPGQMNQPRIQVREVLLIKEAIHPSQVHLQVAVVGNIGEAPDNFKGQSRRFSASIAVNNEVGSDDATWIRLTLQDDRGLIPHFKELEKGQPLLAIGDLSSYLWKGDKRSEISLLEFAKLDRPAAKAQASPDYVDSSVAPVHVSNLPGMF